MAYGGGRQNNMVAVNDGGSGGSRYSQLADYARQQSQKYWEDLLARQEQEREERNRQEAIKETTKPTWENIVTPATEQTPQPVYEPTPEPEVTEQPTPMPQYEEPEPEETTPKIRPVTPKAEDLYTPVPEPQATATPQSAAPVVQRTQRPEDKSRDKTQNIATPADTYNEWEDFLRQQELTEEANDTSMQSIVQPDQSVLGNGYVQPVTPTLTADELKWFNPDGTVKTNTNGRPVQPNAVPLSTAQQQYADAWQRRNESIQNALNRQANTQTDTVPNAPTGMENIVDFGTQGLALPEKNWYQTVLMGKSNNPLAIEGMELGVQQSMDAYNNTNPLKEAIAQVNAGNYRPMDNPANAYTPGVPEDVAEAQAINDARIQTVIDNTPEQYRQGYEYDYPWKIAMGVTNRYNGLLNTIDTNKARNAWVEDQMRANVDPDIMTNAEIQEAMRKYYEEYDRMAAEGEITVPEQRPIVSSDEIKRQAEERQKAAYEKKSQEIAETADWTRDFLTPEDTSREDEIFEEATDAADKLGIKFGTREYWQFVEDYEGSVSQQKENALQRAKERRNQDLFDTLVETGVSASQAERMVENPQNYGWNYETGRPTYTGSNESKLSWEDAIGSERLMDDLMQMNAPAIMKDGTLNTAAQALFTDKLSTDQMLHLFDRGGTFFSPESGVKITPEFAKLIADNPAFASGSNIEALRQSVNLSPEEFAKMFDEFLTANPLIAKMFDLGILTLDDIKDNFFKEVKYGEGSGTGTGTGGNYSYGSGYTPRSYGGYGGYSYGGGSKSKGSTGWIDQSQATARKQQEQRINNIMKNWSF